MCLTETNLRAAALILCLLAAPGVVAQNSAEAAIGLVKHYIERHNAHDLNATVAMYDEDAVFFLSMQRPPVHGREAIRTLEQFDVVAGSTLYPQNLRAEQDGDRWRVHIGGVIEHSRIFEAAGATIVMAQGIDDAFVLQSGKILELRQPDLLEACTGIVLDAFRGASAWLQSANDPRSDALVKGEFLLLTPDTIPAVIAVIHEWRAETDYAPEPAAASACAGFDPLGRQAAGP